MCIYVVQVAPRRVATPPRHKSLRISKPSGFLLPKPFKGRVGVTGTYARVYERPVSPTDTTRHAISNGSVGDPVPKGASGRPRTNSNTRYFAATWCRVFLSVSGTTYRAWWDGRAPNTGQNTTNERILSDNSLSRRESKILLAGEYRIAEIFTIVLSRVLGKGRFEGDTRGLEISTTTCCTLLSAEMAWF